MDQDLIVTRVLSRSSGIPGRSLNSARNHHFVIDEPAYGGGPGEEITPAEAFLAGVSGCAVLLVESFARQWGLPLGRAEVEIAGVRRQDAPQDFLRVEMHFRLHGVEEEDARRLVEAYQGR
ncbi:MAG TPA: OsmC family protein [Dehalococcoidia bacterium]|nr:OsmC family protein [Dehalococcoidia bacterium]